MQLMKKELDDGYNSVISEFQSEQTRLQTHCDQLKRQLSDAQQTIELLKSNLNQLKTIYFDDLSKAKHTYAMNNYVSECENKDQQYNLQCRLENLVKLLGQSNDA